jgi:hypothetical protein
MHGGRDAIAHPASLVLGIAQVSAVVLFMLVLFRTARRSIEPHNPYEKFIASFFLCQGHCTR